jgi:hypothetical protein
MTGVFKPKKQTELLLPRQAKKFVLSQETSRKNETGEFRFRYCSLCNFKLPAQVFLPHALIQPYQSEPKSAFRAKKSKMLLLWPLLLVSSKELLER